MTDEQLDARLRDAGARWRAVTDEADGTPGRPPLELAPAPGVVPGPRRHGPRRGLLISAAVLVAALVAGVAVAVSLLAHRSGSTHPAGPRVRGTVWRLVARGNAAPDPRSSALFHIDRSGNLVADDDCGAFGGRVTVDGGRLAFTHVDDIRYRDCRGRTGTRFDADGFDELTRFPTIRLSAARLTIAAPGTPALRFAPVTDVLPPTTDVPSVTGANWRLTAATDPAGSVHPVTKAARLRISDARLQADDTCNSLTADAAADAQTIELKNVTTTAIGCVGTPVPGIVDAVLSGRVAAQVDGAQLTLSHKGAGSLTYQWVPDDASATAPRQLTDRVWHLVSAGGTRPGVLASLYLDDRGPVSGTDGCAQLDGTAAVGHGSLTVTGVPRAPSADCNASAAAVASPVDRVLAHPAIWAVRDGRLVISSGGAQAGALVYASGVVPLPSTSPAPVASALRGPWTLDLIEHDAAGSSSGASVGSTVVLRYAGGHLRISLRCAVVDVRVTVRGSSLENPSVRTLPHSCPAVATDRSAEARVQRALSTVFAGTATWSVDGDGLSVSRAGTTLHFVRQ